jgi:hypothetical protein
MGNRERIRSTIASGLSGHPREANIERFYEAADGLVNAIEQAAKLSIDADDVDVSKVALQIARVGPGAEGKPERNPDDDVKVVYQKRHTDGWFPFPHEHCYVKICFDWVIDGESVEICIELELPCKVDWPIIGRL